MTDSGKKSGIWWFWWFWWFWSSIGFNSNDSALILMQRIFMLMIMNNGLYQEVCTISPLALFWSRMDFQINDLQLSWCRIIADWLSIEKKSFKFNAWSWGHEKNSLKSLRHHGLPYLKWYHRLGPPILMDRGGPAPSGCGLNCLVAWKKRLGALQFDSYYVD